jgi:hypothetical protein
MHTTVEKHLMKKRKALFLLWCHNSSFCQNEQLGCKMQKFKITVLRSVWTGDLLNVKHK